ncbi:MAG: SH3 domain-containing protein [Actinomycetota bacterium]
MRSNLRLLLVLLAAAVAVVGCGTGDDDTAGGVAVREPAASTDGDGEGGDGTATDGDPAPDDGDGTDGDGTDGDGSDGDGSGTGIGEDPSGESGADTPLDELTWTVIGVAWDDTLNVRAEPSASAAVVTELAPWATDFSATGGLGGTDDTWREIITDDGETGWVNGRFVVGQPAVLSDGDEQRLIDDGEALVAWATAGEGDVSSLISPRGLWAGGIGIYADAGSEWNWIPADELSSTAAWDAERDWIIDEGFECGADCTLSTRRFLNLDRIDATTEVRLNDIPGANEAHLDGMVWEAPPSLHRVVLDTPTSDPDQFFDWQRLHLIPDWSTGEPTFRLAHNHGWTP